MTALEQFGLILWNSGRLFPNLVLNLDELVALGANGVNELCHKGLDILRVGGQGLLFAIRPACASVRPLIRLKSSSF